MRASVCTLAGRRRRRSGANDNLSHKERKRKSAERKERGAETCEWWARVGKKMKPYEKDGTGRDTKEH